MGANHNGALSCTDGNGSILQRYAHGFARTASGTFVEKQMRPSAVVELNGFKLAGVVAETTPRQAIGKTPIGVQIRNTQDD
jgi:hypothetical protein